MLKPFPGLESPALAGGRRGKGEGEAGQGRAGGWSNLNRRPPPGAACSEWALTDTPGPSVCFGGRESAAATHGQPSNSRGFFGHSLAPHEGAVRWLRHRAPFPRAVEKCRQATATRSLRLTVSALHTCSALRPSKHLLHCIPWCTALARVQLVCIPWCTALACKCCARPSAYHCPLRSRCYFGAERERKRGRHISVGLDAESSVNRIRGGGEQSHG